MKQITLPLLVVLAVTTLGFAQHDMNTSQLASPVRGLSEQEISDLLNGNGMGYARMAELNGYPGPRHVLDLSEKLQLSTEQTNIIQQNYDAMKEQAVALGQDIVTREKILSEAFANGTISDAQLTQDLQNLAELYAQLRQVQAHLEITPLLTPEQITSYNVLRGYSNNQHRGHH
jgi:hypothetical protein